MEQILPFVLGVSAGVLIWAVVVAFRTTKKVNTLSEKLDGVLYQIDKNYELVNRRIDVQDELVTNIYKESISYTDSRVDKLQAKITSVNQDGCKPVKKTNQNNKIK